MKDNKLNEVVRMNRFILGRFPIAYVAYEERHGSVYTIGHGTSIFPETADEFMGVVTTAIKSYFYLNGAVAKKISGFIEEMAKEGIEFNHDSKSCEIHGTNFLDPSKYVPFDVTFNGEWLTIHHLVIGTKLFKPCSYLVSEFRNPETQFHIIELTKLYNDRCKEAGIECPTLPLEINTKDTDAFACSYLASLGENGIPNFTHMDLSELSDFLSTTVATTYEIHQMTHGLKNENK